MNQEREALRVLQAQLEVKGWTFEVRGKNGQWKKLKPGSRRHARMLRWAQGVEHETETQNPEA